MSFMVLINHDRFSCFAWARANIMPCQQGVHFLSVHCHVIWPKQMGGRLGAMHIGHRHTLLHMDKGLQVHLDKGLYVGTG